MTAWIGSGMQSEGAEVIAGPGEAGFREAIETAQEGDTVVLTDWVQLRAPVPIDKRLTFRPNPSDAYRVWIEGQFDGTLLHLDANGIVFDGIRLYGSPLTDGLSVDVEVTLRDSLISGFRHPVVMTNFFGFPGNKVRLERCLIADNHQPLSCFELDAKDSTFSGNGVSGTIPLMATIESCIFENNRGYGLMFMNGTVKNSIFRYNSDWGLMFDPDNGYMVLSSSLFYANPGGGLHLREGAYATVDNCTFTRHTGAPAILVSEAHQALFRHCTVADNMFTEGGGAFLINLSAELQNCLIADNPTDANPHGSGLVGNFGDGGGNVIGGPAGLSALRDNGGPTLTLQPLPGSVAIDAGRASDVVRDARGLSRLAGAAPDAGAIETDAGAVADADGDNLPDIWERFHALNPGDPADASSDTDRDGQTALAEYKSGTDPADAQSVHRVTEIRSFRGSAENIPRVFFAWTRYPGVLYEVETSTDLRQWHKVPSWFSPGGSLLYFGDFQAYGEKEFFRVVAELQE